MIIILWFSCLVVIATSTNGPNRFFNGMTFCSNCPQAYMSYSWNQVPELYWTEDDAAAHNMPNLELFQTVRTSQDKERVYVNRYLPLHKVEYNDGRYDVIDLVFSKHNRMCQEIALYTELNSVIEAFNGGLTATVQSTRSQVRFTYALDMFNRNFEQGTRLLVYIPTSCIATIESAERKRQLTDEEEMAINETMEKQRIRMSLFYPTLIME